ncbi:MAG: phosphoribosyl-ATP diphosphatase [Bosea sp. (in: a-proteobacteria)]|nr:phosphoribosyl-ATP diphosphatase [Bosea sp. (in: a-proteobacteria)]
MSDSLNRLHAAVQEARSRDPSSSRTAKLFADGLPKMAKKVAEEAVELGIEALQGHRQAAVLESADLIYNLVTLWAAIGIEPDEIWRELDRREQLYGIAEKLPKKPARAKQARRPPPVVEVLPR